MEDEDFLNFIENVENESANFWEKEYPKMSRVEKVNYWLSSTLKGMRAQGESINDEYSEFSKQWYDFAISVEPDFDNIFQDAMKNIGFDFDWKEYSARIQENGVTDTNN